MGGSPRIVCIHQGVELYGSDRSFLQAVTALRESFPGAHITVVLPGEGPLNPLFAGLADRVQVRSLAILRLAEPVKTLLKGTIALPWYLLRAGIDLARADLVYINTAVVADYMLASRLAPRKSVIHVREIPKPKAMPVIRAHRPDARFAIVGRNPTAEVEALASADPSVIVTGGVDDVRGWLAAADVVVAPLRIARGVQNKVLEAMAMARPVVASVQAAEGISAEPGRDLLVGRDAAEEAALVLDLLAAPERARAMGLAARARVIDAYGWDAAMAPLAQMLGRDAAKDKAV